MGLLAPQTSDDAQSTGGSSPRLLKWQAGRQPKPALKILHYLHSIHLALITSRAVLTMQQNICASPSKLASGHHGLHTHMTRKSPYANIQCQAVFITGVPASFPMASSSLSSMMVAEPCVAPPTLFCQALKAQIRHQPPASWSLLMDSYAPKIEKSCFLLLDIPRACNCSN